MMYDIVLGESYSTWCGLEKCCVHQVSLQAMSIHEKDRADRTEGSSPTPELDYTNQMVKFKAMPFVLC